MAPPPENPPPIPPPRPPPLKPPPRPPPPPRRPPVAGSGPMISIVTTNTKPRASTFFMEAPALGVLRYLLVGYAGDTNGRNFVDLLAVHRTLHRLERERVVVDPRQDVGRLRDAPVLR